MKVTLTLNGKSVEVELTEEQLKTLGIEEKKKTGYERVDECKHYWYVDSEGRATEEIEEGDPFDHDGYAAANYYSDENVAKDNARADTLMRKLRRYAAEHGGIGKPDHGGLDVVYDIVYSNISERIEVGGTRCVDRAGVVHFNSEQSAKDAIKEFHEDLVWYFTEYKPQL